MGGLGGSTAAEHPPVTEASRAGGRPRSLPPGVRNYTLRMPAEVMRQMNQLALDQDTTARAILLRGLNMVFRENNLPPIAE